MSSSAPSDSVNGPGKSQKPRVRLNPDEKLAVYVASQELIKVSCFVHAFANEQGVPTFLLMPVLSLE